MKDFPSTKEISIEMASYSDAFDGWQRSVCYNLIHSHGISKTKAIRLTHRHRKLIDEKISLRYTTEEVVEMIIEIYN
jgi:hypothetical protein